MKFNITVEYDIENEWQGLDETIHEAVVNKISDQIMWQLINRNFDGGIIQAAKDVKRIIANQIANILKDEIDTKAIEGRVVKMLETNFDKKIVDKYSYKIQKNIEKDLDQKIKDIVRKDIKSTIGNAFK